MKFTAFAFLITGLTTGLLLPGQASADPGYATPDPSRYGAGWGQYAPAVPRTTGAWQAPAGPGYRFRPWTERESELIRQRSAPYPMQPVSMPWGAPPRGNPSAAAIGRWAPPEYRFRPMDPQQPNPAGPKQTGYVYRPMQIEIPGQYVYRPLNPVKKAPCPEYRPPMPAPIPRYVGSPMIPPAGYAFGGFPTYPQPPMGLRAQPQSRYVYANPYNRPRFRPQPPSDRYVAHYPGVNRMPAPGYVYREPRSRPYRGYPSQYAWRPEDREPGFDRRLSTRSGPYSAFRGPVDLWMRRGPAWGSQGLGQAAPPPRMPPNRPDGRDMVQNRYGVDWYDGRSDGEGAWYKLVESKEWPRVTQHLTGK